VKICNGVSKNGEADYGLWEWICSEL